MNMKKKRVYNFEVEDGDLVDGPITTGWIDIERCKVSLLFFKEQDASIEECQDEAVEEAIEEARKCLSGEAWYSEIVSCRERWGIMRVVFSVEAHSFTFRSPGAIRAEMASYY